MSALRKQLTEFELMSRDREHDRSNMLKHLQCVQEDATQVRRRVGMLSELVCCLGMMPLCGCFTFRELWKE